MKERTILSKETVIQSSVLVLCLLFPLCFIYLHSNKSMFKKESAGSRGEAMGGEKNQ